MRILFILLFILNSTALFAQHKNAVLKKVPLHYRYSSTNNINEVKYFSEVKNKYENNLLKEKYEYYNDTRDSSKRLTYYYYDANKYITQTIYRRYGENIQRYYNTDRVRYYYTDNYRSVCQYWEHGVPAEGVWYPNYKYYISKDAFGNVTLDGIENYDFDTKLWSGSFTKSTYIYKENTDLILTKIDSFTFEPNVYSPRYKWINEYDSLGRIKKSENYIFYPGTWNLSSKSFITYVGDAKEPNTIKSYIYNYENSAIYSVYIADSLKWNWYDKSAMLDAIYIRDGQYKPINSYELKHYSYLDTTLKVESKTKLTYLDANGSNVKEMFDTLNNKFIPTFKTYKFYNGNRNLTEISTTKYNRNTNTWDLVGSDYYVNLYNPDNTLKEVTHTYADFTIKEEYLDYVEINTGYTTDKNTIQVSLYPNPSTNGSVNINVNLEAASALSIKVSDMKGSIVYTDERNVGKGLNTIELKNLQQGMYIVELNTKYGISIAKLLVQ